MTLRIGMFIALIVALCWPAAPAAAAMLVPVDVQIALFVNIWKLDRNFDPSHGVTLAIVYQDNFADSVMVKDDLIEAVEKLKLPITCLPINAPSGNDLRDRLAVTQATVIYVAPLRAIDIGVIV